MTSGGSVKRLFFRINRDTKTIPSETEESGCYIHNGAGIIFLTDIERVPQRTKRNQRKPEPQHGDKFLQHHKAPRSS